MRSQASGATCFRRAKTPALIHSWRQSRIVVAEQEESAIASCGSPPNGSRPSIASAARAWRV
jgi:hypothetical protein